ncbi:type VI secretion system membrane subunit TssM [Rhodovulum strictum]|uniref:Type VI secretion system membrane subunit TssM n=1 Tax=Rhodovulum strictum TaxID=58314 RepID=A0A844BHV0_9RHOB|nr:type VI secretion system membrane subunit TssM [Rhodovulum strictum]MRH21075.1 type VI secretion system membrane subunit TssM [Rhodovulum strictum]
MGGLKAVFGFLISRLFWTLIGLVLLCALIWVYGPVIRVGEVAPLSGELARIVTIGLIVIGWLAAQLIRQIRAARANRVFVTELAQPKEAPPPVPGAENIAEVGEKFQGVLERMKRSKLGGRKFLRDMPWYVIIGPPGTGKTTALRQSGLHFPIELGDDLRGMGGTRNCDWFFTEDAVLIDTAGRYTEQQSDPATDAAEWSGFLDLLKRHRGRRALNGVIVTLSVLELTGDEAALRAHGREIRKRLAELYDRLQMRLPVYLMITKADLIPGFEPFFADLSTRAREQVWGATLGTEARVDGVTVAREMTALVAEIERRIVPRMAEDRPLATRGEVFRFPAQIEALTGPMKALIDTVFGENRYEDSAWLRGFYLTSATQEGSPVDLLVGSLARRFGLPANRPEPRAHRETRSYFLHDMMARLIFPEAGLGTFDPRAEERRAWIFRGTLAGATLVTVLAGALFLFSFLRYSGGIADQERQLTLLQSRLANVAARQAPTEPLDLELALDAVDEVADAETRVPRGLLTALGPSAAAEIERAQRIAYERALRNILEPRMVALLEATMWKKVRDPDYMLGALKVYQMITGLAPYNTEFARGWWQQALPAEAPIDPFPTGIARAYQLDALARMAGEEDRIVPDPALVSAALESVCTIPLATRAYRALMAAPEVAGLPEWIPAEHAGPNGARVLTRLSERTLRVGLPGAFTHRGFHEVVLPLVPEAAAQAALDRAVFAGGCPESAGASVATLEGDILKLYYEDFIATWDGFLRDIRLAPIGDLAVAQANLKDLSSADSALRRLLRAIVAETHLTRPAEPGAAMPPGAMRVAEKTLGKVGRLASKTVKTVSDIAALRPDAPPPGEPVADHFAPIRGTIEEIAGQPPTLEPAIAALSALSNELQTVAASPDPEAALLARGGLPQLTGAIANQAAILPDPVDAWIAGIAGDAIAVTRDAVLAQLNARWRADVLSFCRAAIAGRYPFDPASRIDVNIADFARLFGPGGLIDSFTTTHLATYVDSTARPWRWRADFGLTDDRLVPFQRARAIRDGLFPGGAGPVIAFSLEPKDLSPNASRVTLNVDGQMLAYFNAAARPMPMTWPGPDGTNLVSLSFTPVDGSPEVITSETGAWAFLRLLRANNLQPTELPELFRLTLGRGGFSARFDLRAGSVDNPFDLGLFGGFSCPDGF